MVVEPEQRIRRSTLLVVLLEIGFLLGVRSVVWLSDRGKKKVSFDSKWQLGRAV